MPRAAAPSLVLQLPSDRYSDMKQRERTFFEIEAAISKWHHQKSVQRDVRRQVKELKKRTDEAVRRRCCSGSNHVRKGSADVSLERTARLHHSVGGKRIAKFPRYGNVNRDRLKQWETLEEGVRLVHGDILPKRQRHKPLEPRDPEGTDERRSSFTNAAIAQA